ncbi:MAG: sulfite exporter TauE/SafE family protein [Hyphomicrobiales bacterium]
MVLAKHGAAWKTRNAGQHQSMNLGTSLVLFGAGLLGGAVNAVAGGATFFTFPAFMAAGLPAIWANASSSVALTPGNLGGLLSERAQLPAFDRSLKAQLALAMLGGGIGALLLLYTSDRVFAALVPALIGVATLVFAVSRPLQDYLRTQTGGTHHHPRWRLALFLPTAIYGGYFGAGMGVVMMALFSVTSDWSVRSANAVKNMMGAAVNWVAIVIFTLQGVVAWPQTLVMLTGALIGGYAGGRLLRVVPAPWIRGFVVAMGLVMTVYYAGKYWF